MAGKRLKPKMRPKPKSHLNQYVENMVKAGTTQAQVYAGVKGLRYQAEELYTKALTEARKAGTGAQAKVHLDSYARQLGATIKYNLEGYSRLLKRLQVEDQRKRDKSPYNYSNKIKQRNT